MAGELLDRVLRAAGKDPATFDMRSTMGKLVRQRGVSDSSELSRIVALPKRELDVTSPEALDLAELISSAYRKKNAPRMPNDQKYKLFPIQARCLQELHDYGLIAPIPVGQGKTLISFLAGAVLDSRRPLLIIPAKLKDKTQEALAFFQQVFDFPLPQLLSYEKLSLVQYKNYLMDYQPDLIVCDEAHKLKNPRGPRAKRLRQYLELYPKTKFVPLSGTLTSRSLNDYAHLAKWALGDMSPLPHQWHFLQEWRDALDVKIAANRRLAPGALVKLCNPDEGEAFRNDPVKTVRQAFARRFLSTPGVVSSNVDPLAARCSLQIDAEIFTVSETTSNHFKKLRGMWETPDGHPFSFPWELWRHARELCSGFYYRWNPRAPNDWLNARKQWAGLCREASQKRHKGFTFETEKDVANGIDDGTVEDPFNFLADWRAIRGTFIPNTEAVWHDDSAINYVVNWCKENKGIIWVEHQAFGRRLQQELGYRYFQSGGADDKGPIYKTSEAEDGCIIASIASNGEGQDLQHGWSNNLITSVPTTNLVWEQLIGRTHRHGQEADEVKFDVMLGCSESLNGFNQACSDARYQNQTQDAPKKLLLADITKPNNAEMSQLVLQPEWL